MDSLDTAIVVDFFGLLVVKSREGFEDTVSEKREIFNHLFKAIRDSICLRYILNEMSSLTFTEGIQCLKGCFGAEHMLNQVMQYL